ncbi:xylose operon transcription regulator XylR [Proteiniphilum sp. UBA5463]|jgi:LacI family transcriptional regulator|uniref:AraC family transcriptional regulator n=1 Tax=Proteiniphilum sp. UBA5463 TaxID=1947281 RepID=UPI00257E3094|nr:DNA-binding transcriptional regulator [Proteiniphilum sp. UBA5463]
MIKVLVLIDSTTEFSRRFLTGLIQYANENGPWTFYRLPSYYKALYGESGIVERIKEWKIEAVIAQWEYEGVDFLDQLDIPVFLQSYRNISGRFSKISGDYIGAGVMAAQFFAKRHFKNFAFYGNKNFFWSKARAEGYRREVERIRGNYYYFESELLDSMQWSREHVELDNWLQGLPKPVALFACDDNFALQVSEMCKVNNINIPDELSLLGVDNDELICNLSHPSISSIVTDDENGGYQTGKMLQNLILNKNNIPFNINIDPVRIELRQSTEKYNISDSYVKTVLDYIHENIRLNISIDELTAIVPLSRRNLEKKFREATGTSVHQFILDKKVDLISTELLTTDKDLLDIAIETGFNDVRNVYRIFKKYTGYTPVSFRKKYLQK